MFFLLFLINLLSITTFTEILSAIMSYSVYIFHTYYEEEQRIKTIANQNNVFVDFAILHRPWLTIWHLGFKKPHVNLQSTFLLQNFLWIILDQKQNTKKKSCFALEKLPLKVVNKWRDIDQPIWPWQHLHRQALLENWKLSVQVISILNYCLLGMHGPRCCNNLVWLLSSSTYPPAYLFI